MSLPFSNLLPSREAGCGNPLLRFSRGHGWPSSRPFVLPLPALLFLEKLFLHRSKGNGGHPLRCCGEAAGGHPLLSSRRARGGHLPSWSRELGVTTTYLLLLVVALLCFSREA